MRTGLQSPGVGDEGVRAEGRKIDGGYERATGGVCGVNEGFCTLTTSVAVFWLF